MKKHGGEKITLARETLSLLDQPRIRGGVRTEQVTLCLACPDTWTCTAYGCPNTELSDCC